jgi:hypothetical protein
MTPASPTNSSPTYARELAVRRADPPQAAGRWPAAHGPPAPVSVRAPRARATTLMERLAAARERARPHTSWRLPPEICTAISQSSSTCVADVMVEQFGAFLLLELWVAASSPRAAAPGSGAGPDSARGDKRSVRRATFRVMTSSLAVDDDTARELTRALADIPLRPPPLDVELVESAPPARPGCRRCWTPEAPRRAGCTCSASRCSRVYRQAKTGVAFPVLLRTARRGLAHALRQTASTTSPSPTPRCAPHYHELGRRTPLERCGRPIAS